MFFTLSLSLSLPIDDWAGSFTDCRSAKCSWPLHYNPVWSTETAQPRFATAAATPPHWQVTHSPQTWPITILIHLPVPCLSFIKHKSQITFCIKGIIHREMKICYCFGSFQTFDLMWKFEYAKVQMRNEIHGRGFGTALLRWVNHDGIFIFGWTIPLTMFSLSIF